MFRIDDATAANSLPAPEAAGTEGYFTEGNPATGTPATNVRGSWLNMIQEELRAIVIAGGGTPSKTTYNQVLTAIQALVAQPSTNKVSGVVGQVRSLGMAVTTASASATLTADEIVVESALGGTRYCLPNFTKTINLATTGAGGMDAGSAPASGFVALYAIYNPTTQTAALLAQNASTLRASVYAGANMPSGYTASALIGVWPTNGSGQFVVGYQVDRSLFLAPTTALTTSTQQASYTSLSIGAVVPLNAKSISGEVAINSSTTASNACFLSGSANAIGEQQINNGNGGIVGNFAIPLVTAQTLFYKATSSAGTMSLTIAISGYTI
jgi:hypothetical protein